MRSRALHVAAAILLLGLGYLAGNAAPSFADVQDPLMRKAVQELSNIRRTLDRIERKVGP